MKVVFVNPTQGGVDYWRFWNPARELKARGWDVKSFPFQKVNFSADEWFNELYPADIVVFGWNLCGDYVRLPSMLKLIDTLKMNEGWNPRIVIDIDDHIDRIPTGFYNKESIEKYLHIYQQLWSVADGILCSTPQIYEYYKQFSKTYLCQNAVNETDFYVRPKGNERIRIGWAGGGQHRYDIAPMVTSVQQLLKERDDIELVTCGIKFGIDSNRYFHYEHAPFETWFNHLAFLNIDIGIVYQEDNEFNNAKSNLKYMENAMMSTPSVYCGQGSYDCIKNGHTGLIAKDIYEIVTQVRVLLDSPKYRNKISKNARKDVLENWNIKNHIRSYENAFKEIYGNGNNIFSDTSSVPSGVSNGVK